jgi:MYXO-CTERM domain-containing protein
VAGLAMTSAAMAQWTGVTINDGTAFFRVATAGTGTTLPASSTGSATGFQADFRLGSATSTDQLYTNWWWYRTANDTREHGIASPAGSAAVSRTLLPGQVTYSNIQPQTTGGNSGLRFALNYRVVDLDGAGNGAAIVYSTLTVTNTGTTDILGLNLFNYVDYFLNGQDANDIVPLTNTGTTAGGDRWVTVNDTLAPGLGMSHIGIGASSFGVGSFGAVGGQMTDINTDNFNNFNNGATPTAGQDLTGVFQWNFGTIIAGGSASATSVVVIPTPAAAALMGLGGLVATRRRRA